MSNNSCKAEPNRREFSNISINHDMSIHLVRATGGTIIIIGHKNFESVYIISEQENFEEKLTKILEKEIELFNNNDTDM